MTFMAMVIALVLLQVWGAGNPVQQDSWFTGLQSSVRGLGFSAATVFFLYLLVPVLLVELILSAVESLLFGLIWIGGAVVVLLYSFGRVEFGALADRYRSYCLGGDFEAAYLFAQSELGVEPDDESLTTAETVHMAIQRELLYVGYQRWFAVLFYFVMLGPAGALAYRLLQLSRQAPERGLAVRLLYYADWIPVRLLAAGFALTGDFLGSRDELVASVSGTQQGSGAVLLEVGRAAIGASDVESTGAEASFATVAAREVTDLQALLARSAGAWLVAISLLVLFW